MKKALLIGITLVVLGTVATWTVNGMRSGIEARQAAFSAQMAELSK